MLTSDEILDKIIKLKGLKNDAALARLFKVKPNTVTNWRQRNSIPYDHIVPLCEHEKWSLSWILMGQINTKYIDINGKKILTTADEPGIYKQDSSYKEGIINETSALHINNIPLEIQPVVDAVVEVMTSNNEVFKIALTQNAFAFQQSVRGEQKISKLENDIAEIRRLLSPREDDFKIQELKGETKAGGGNGE